MGVADGRPSTAKLRLAAALLAWAPGLYQTLVRRGRSRRPRQVFAEARADLAKTRREPPRVLVVDDDLPDPARDAGAKAIFHLVELLREAGTAVVFWCDTGGASPSARDLLAGIGVAVATRGADGELADWLDALDDDASFDAVILNRPMAAAIHGPAVHRSGCGRCVYYGHDIHYLRMRAGRRVAAASISAFELACITRIEQRIWRSVDVALYPSADEAAIVNDYRKSRRLPPNGAVLPLWSVSDAPHEPASPARRSGMLFVGSFAHPPNLDGLNWFFAEILPRVRALGCHDVVHVVGNGMERYVPGTHDPAVEIRGWVDTDTLDALYSRVRVAVAPLRYGGGVKGKVLEAMAHGVPCVSTPAALQGLPATRIDKLPNNDPGAFAANIVELMGDDALWQQRSQTASAYLRDAYGRAVLRQRATQLILGGGNTAANATDGSLRPA